MSRSLGANCRRKARIAEVSPEQEGRNAFSAGLPASANPYSYSHGHGKGHSWARGWKRQQDDARKKGGTA